MAAGKSENDSPVSPLTHSSSVPTVTTRKPQKMPRWCSEVNPSRRGVDRVLHDLALEEPIQDYRPQSLWESIHRYSRSADPHEAHEPPDGERQPAHSNRQNDGEDEVSHVFTAL